MNKYSGILKIIPLIQYSQKANCDVDSVQEMKLQLNELEFRPIPDICDQTAETSLAPEENITAQTLAPFTKE